jgi:transcriptional regulator with XRE-family HTH domain
MRPRTRPGRTIRYRNLPALAIPDDFPILTCSRCRFEQLNEKTRAALAPILHEEYRNALRVRIRRAIDTLSHYISQRRLEKLLGLSQGYLSRLRAGAGSPSPELVSNLALLAQDPKVRLSELERYWAKPALDDPSSDGAEESAELAGPDSES